MGFPAGSRRASLRHANRRHPPDRVLQFKLRMTPSSSPNCATSSGVRAWLARHPRRVFHFTPTSASWLNAVEGFFAILTKRRLKCGVFRSLVDLQAAINRFLGDHNAQTSRSSGSPIPTRSSQP
jgi:hypothetical protein